MRTSSSAISVEITIVSPTFTSVKTTVRRTMCQNSPVAEDLAVVVEPRPRASCARSAPRARSARTRSARASRAATRGRRRGRRAWAAGAGRGVTLHECPPAARDSAAGPRGRARRRSRGPGATLIARRSPGAGSRSSRIWVICALARSAADLTLRRPVMISASMFWRTWAFSTFTQFGAVGTNQLDVAAFERREGRLAGVDAHERGRVRDHAGRGSSADASWASTCRRGSSRPRASCCCWTPGSPGRSRRGTSA